MSLKKSGNAEPKSFSVNENVKADNLVDRTIMYYMLGSDLEENSLAGTEIIDDICKVNYPSNMNFIIMTGGSNNEEVEKTRKDPEFKEKFGKYYDINWSINQIWKVENNAINVIEKDFGKEDMTEEKTLEKFVSYAKKNYPAKKHDIIFSDHGGAGLYSFGTGTRYLDADTRCLSIKELTDAFKNANIKFNTVGFDACLMASFELMCVGTELKLGEVRIPKVEKREADKVTWSIFPEEDRWFSVKDNSGGRLVEFVVEENEKSETDAANLNYLFDKSISGFIPAILRRYEDDQDEDNIIQIHVDFTGANKEGKVIGFTRYDQNANMSVKDLEEFKKGDKVVFIANFEDFKTTKYIAYMYATELPILDLKVLRGNTHAQSMYFKYSVEDIYFETYDFDVTNQFAFAFNDNPDMCFYATFPLTWTDVVINASDSSFESLSTTGGHTGKLKIDMFDITNDTIHFGDVRDGSELPESTIDYLKKDKVFDEIYDVEENYLVNGKD